jgi:fatty-acyl-CoA synthase
MAPSPGTITGSFDAMVRIQPSHPAIFFEHEVYTYGELQALAQQAGRALIAAGVRPGDSVGALLGNRPEWMALYLASGYAGASFVPLNTWYKASELRWTLKHCEISILVTTACFLNRDFSQLLRELLPELTAQPHRELRSAAFPKLRSIVMFGEPMAGTLGWKEFLDSGRTIPQAELQAASAATTPAARALILYTSGSMAEPKGVILNHRGVVENGFDMGVRRQVERDDRVWLGTPLFYGLGATNAVPVTLTHGAALVLQESFDAGAAIELIARTRATVYYGTGNITRAILDHANFDRRKIATLRKGNAGTLPEYKRMSLLGMGLDLACSAYGLTESYGNATVGMPDDPVEVKLATNGRPLPGTELLIVDPQTYVPLPQGKCGLVLLRGNVVSEYLHQPEGASEAFRGDGFFDSGDLGWLDADGRFIFHARKKEVIKSNGINVSPLEVEQLLVQHKAVKDAHVVGVPHRTRGELIVAFVDICQPVEEDDLKKFVRANVASFKVPQHIFFRTEAQLPRLASGKIAKFHLIDEALSLLA